ncbi:Phosphomannomutase [Segniliparus rotundus DSM 44985]|uniref:Phosphomannomutase n=1 Tax=Segniliparus rotundus (strain ATCC BAA-972 / CDC 1076 / CIP 108378 / DSM 44985 / JCM 13578) TaxID=640132 RepID=D6ZCS0_SEGRD|nr:phosphomannomutase/phosphoglucomutase [Segniliparus rotundus]ADG97112.1 Phosphomannomutase [Segniliparus rotundus DSM 44985]
MTGAGRGGARSPEAIAVVVKAYDVRGVVGEQIDEGLIADLGAAFAQLMRSEGATSLVIGHDMRDSSGPLSDAFARGALAQGLDVTSIGLASTDELYFASGVLDRPGAMFTASHNPAKYNGVKLCRAGAKPVGKETGLGEISQALISGVRDTEGAAPGERSAKDVLEDYAQYLRDLVGLARIRPLTVVVDAGNGMAGHTAPAVLGPIEGLTVIPMFFELDGNFPNHEANPLDPKNIVDLQAKVRATGADLGLAFDGDADRCFVVDERGDAISPSAITALVAERSLEKSPGSVIIHNAIVSRAVPELVRERGGVPERTKVGHSFIKQRMAETGAVFGGEHSAHYYFRDFWGADSGMLAALHVLAALGASDRTASELMDGYERYAASGEINSTVSDAKAAIGRVLDGFAERATSVDELDGVTVDLGDGAWFNLRASNTEPLLRLNAEAADRANVDAITEEVLTLIRGE